jgi:hypothetical protein
MKVANATSAPSSKESGVVPAGFAQPAEITASRLFIWRHFFGGRLDGAQKNSSAH